MVSKKGAASAGISAPTNGHTHALDAEVRDLRRHLAACAGRAAVSWRCSPGGAWPWAPARATGATGAAMGRGAHRRLQFLARGVANDASVFRGGYRPCSCALPAGCGDG